MAKKNAPYKAFGEMLERLRLLAGIKHQAEFATLVKTTQQTVSRWERGLSRPREKELPLISHVLNFDNLADLLAAAGYGSTPMSPKKMPVLTLDRPFPIDALTPDSFERFCHYFLAKCYPEGTVHRAGGSGHTQDGADVEVTFPDGKRYSFQCKRAGEFGPAKVRAAVTSHKRKAVKKFLLLTRVASPQARDAVAKHRSWEIWDKEDISRRIRELSKEEQRQLVDVFFRGQRLALLGEDESGPWQTLDFFFEPFMGKQGAFNHTWPLVGREKEIQTLLESLLANDIKVILLVATGGGGKSRILKQVVDKFHELSREVFVRFLSPTSEITEKSLEDLGTAQKILVVDDAHDRNDLPLLFQYAARGESKAKLLLALRPYGVDYLKAQAGTFALSGDAIREIKLAPPTLDDTTALAKEVLTEYGSSPEVARAIAQATRDCPLATVMAAQIVAKEGHHFELAKNDDSFRSTLFGKFQDVIAGDIGEKTDAEQIRKLLRVLALVQPFHPDDPVIVKTVESVEGLAIPQVNRLVRLLSDSGVLFKRGGLYRLSPDLLADFIIEKACVGEGGKSTGYAEQIFDNIRDPHVQRLLLNLGKLDWRLNNGDPSTSPLMPQIWARLRLRQNYCIKAVAEVSYFQPGPALEYAEGVIQQGYYAPELLDILKYASYSNSMEHAPRAFDLLWRLVTERNASPSAESAIKLLVDLCAVEPNKPYFYNKLVVEFALSLVKKDASWNGKYTPLHILEGILRTCGDTCESNGRQVRINRYNVSPAVVAPLRRQVVDLAVSLLKHEQTRISLDAARLLKKALQYPMYSAIRREWTSEFLGTLEQIEKTMTTVCLDPLVVVELARSVSWLAHYANDDTSPIASRIQALMPNSLEVRTTLALVDEYGETFERIRDIEKSERERVARLQSLTTDLIKAFPDARDLYTFIEARVQHVEEYSDEKKRPTLGLYWQLLDASQSLVDLTIEKTFAHPSTQRQGYAGAALAMKLAKDRTSGIQIAKRFLNLGTEELHIAVINAYNCIDPATFLAEDINIVRELLASPVSSVLPTALWIVRRMALSEQSLALDLMRRIDFGESAERADSVLSLFGHPIPLESLSEQVIFDFLNKLAALHALDGSWIETFLAYASEHYADMTSNFFMKRVELAAAQKDWRVRPCNYGPFAHIGLRFRESKAFNDILRRVMNWMRSRGDDYPFIQHSSHLFQAMFGFADERVVALLGDWIDVATPDELKSIGTILNKASPDFVFDETSLVMRILERAAKFGRDLLRKIGGELFSAAVGGMRSGVAGEPFPQDIKMKEAAKRVLAEMPRFSPAYELYEAIRKHAEREIERCRQEADFFED